MSRYKIYFRLNGRLETKVEYGYSKAHVLSTLYGQFPRAEFVAVKALRSKLCIECGKTHSV